MAFNSSCCEVWRQICNDCSEVTLIGIRRFASFAAHPTRVPQTVVVLLAPRPLGLPRFSPLSSPPRSPPAVGVHASPSAFQKSLIEGPSFGRSHNGGEHGICISPPRAKARVLRLPSTNADGRKNCGPPPLPPGLKFYPNAIAFGCVPCRGRCCTQCSAAPGRRVRQSP